MRTKKVKAKFESGQDKLRNPKLKRPLNHIHLGLTLLTDKLVFHLFVICQEMGLGGG